MTGMTTYSAQNWLKYISGSAAMPALPTSGEVWVALFTAVGTDAGTGFTEVSGGSYARVSTGSSGSAAWNTPTSASPSVLSNSGAITFPQSTASWGTVLGFGVYDAVTSGNLLWWDYLGAFNWAPFTCTSASPGVLTSTAHGYSNGDPVVVTAEYGGTLPTTGGSWSGVLTVANVTTDTFTAGVNTTGTGDGMVRKIVQQSIPANVTPSFAGGSPGQLVLLAA